MTRRTIIVMTLSLLAVTLFSSATALAYSAAELKERFKARYQSLVSAKEAGKVGETYKGFVEAVKAGESEKAITTLISEENSDREELYKAIAQKAGTGEEKTTPEKVGEQNGERNFKNATAGTYLKGRDGKWTRK